MSDTFDAQAELARQGFDRDLESDARCQACSALLPADLAAFALIVHLLCVSKRQLTYESWSFPFTFLTLGFVGAGFFCLIYRLTLKIRLAEIRLLKEQRGRGDDEFFKLHERRSVAMHALWAWSDGGVALSSSGLVLSLFWAAWFAL